jgi:hypothetical protein
MSRNRKDIPMWAKLGHAKPTNRREFLATGVLPFAAWAVGPSLLTLLNPERAFGADNCAAASSKTFIPFITVNLAGGASLAGGVVAKNLDGGNLSSYSKLGQGNGPGISYNPEKEFGNVEFAGTAIGGSTTGLVSKFLTGVRDPRAQNMRIAALDNTAFVWQAVASGDDSSANPVDITGLVLRMGLTGNKLPNLGRADTSTGIGQKPSMYPPPAPFVVGSVNDLANALGYASGLAGLKTEQKTALARVISSLSASQVRRIGQTDGATVVTQLVECAGIKNIDLIATGGGDVNPFAVGGMLSGDLAKIWNINVNDKTSQDATIGAMVYNGLVGNASTININLGGFDYHDNTRTTGNTRDLSAGAVVGKILETAAYLKKPCFVYVCSDGATTSSEASTADAPWVSDRGISGMQYMLTYDPTKRIETTASHIGGFNDGQAADGRFVTAANAELAAQAVFANYASLNGETAFMEQNRILGDAATRALCIKFQKG